MEILSVVIGILLSIVAATYWYIHHTLQYWKNRNVPHIEPEFFYGNARGISKQFSPNEFVQRMYLKLKTMNVGPVAGVYLLIQKSVYIMDLDLIKQILVRDFNIFTNRGIYHNEKDDPLSANLAAVEDEAWRSLRQKITPTFTSGKLKTMFATIVDISNTLVKTIRKESSATGQLEIKLVLSRFTTDVIGSTAFGIECNSLEDPTTLFYQMGIKTFSNINFVKRTFLATFSSLGKKLRMTTTNKEIGDFYMDVIKRTVNYREQHPEIHRNDFLNLLLKLKGPDALTFNQLAAQSVVFFNAGFETSSTTLTFCMYELSINEDIQRKARESVIKVLEKHGNEYTYEAVNDMEYVEQCINETLRLHSPALGTARIAKRDYPIPKTNIIIEKGTTVTIPFSGIHLDPDIYPNPRKFDPDRFSPEEVEKRHPFAFLPFGEGPRICIGMRFAVLEMKIALAKILTNFEFALDRTKTTVPILYATNRILLAPKEDVIINFKSI
ncbi:hypothetical protein HA402_015588 [Bradysia odoriphaga]|nr:hypothetical protein HA402_015588 [Bradysia odoriphaga]